MKKIVTGFMIFCNFLFANYLTNINFNNNNALEIYKTAIYDTYLQLNKFIEEGVDTHYLKQFEGKIVVGVITDNLPTNDILYLSVIGTKNFFQVKTAYDSNSKKGFLIFSAYDREADANYALKKLRALGISAVKVYNGKWYNNPVLVNAIITQLKNTALANFPTKVIVKEKYIIVPKPQPIIIRQKVPVTTPSKPTISNNNQTQSDKYLQKLRKQKILKLVTLITHIKREGIPVVKDDLIGFKYRGKFYTKGSQIQDFTITEAKKDFYVYKCRKYLKAIFRFDDFNNYHLVFRIPLRQKAPNCVIEPNKKQNKHINKYNKNIKPQPNCDNGNCNEEAQPIINQIIKQKEQNKSQTQTNTTPKNTQPQTQPQKQTQTTSNSNNSQVNNFYTCDLRRIKVIYQINGNGNFTKVFKDYTPYKALGITNLYKVGEKGDFVVFNKNGMPNFAMKTIQWNAVCKKEK